MATSDYFGAASSLLGGIGSYFASQSAAEGSLASAASYKKAAKYTEVATKFKLLAATRQIYQTLGAGRAAIGANNIVFGGSAADVMRASASEGAIAKALISLQGALDVAIYKGQAEAATAAAEAEETSGIFSLIGGVIGAAGSIAMAFSDDRLKVDVTLKEWYPERGFGLYRYRFVGSPIFYLGVLAGEIERVRPDAVSWTEDGYRMVDYDKIGIPLRMTGAA